MAKKGNRQHIVLKSEETGHTYHSTKNKRNTPDRIEIKKYNPMSRKHETYKEEK
ncbi:50S ribosomal protein L33 [bacterium]|jgi:large subunit ribosomal protein L33|nr:50S ribosomal protein L33 [bacterium]